MTQLKSESLDCVTLPLEVKSVHLCIDFRYYIYKCGTLILRVLTMFPDSSPEPARWFNRLIVAL